MADPRRFGNTLRLREEAARRLGLALAGRPRRATRASPCGRCAARPAFAAVAIVSLALATGATTAIFSVVNGVLLRPLPFGRSRSAGPGLRPRLARGPRRRSPDPIDGPVGPGARGVRAAEHARSRRSPATALTTAHLDGPSGAERLTAVAADLAFFAVLGVAALVGRTFRAGDAPDVAVISAALWQRRFDGDPVAARAADHAATAGRSRSSA